jgi:futalosine hydrolase
MMRRTAVAPDEDRRPPCREYIRGVSTGTLLIVVATEAERPQAGGGEVLVCGVGKSAAATATALRLADGGVRGVISFGVAGAYPGAGLDVGDVVVATEVAVIDEGLEDGAAFRPFARPGMPVPGADWAPTDPVLRSELALAGHGFQVVGGRIATVSVCAGSERLARERASTGAVAEGMEGAAVALAAARHGVPFAEVRGISNPCGPRDGAPFDLETAVRHAAAVLA